MMFLPKTAHECGEFTNKWKNMKHLTKLWNIFDVTYIFQWGLSSIGTTLPAEFKHISKMREYYYFNIGFMPVGGLVSCNKWRELLHFELLYTAFFNFE